jgi:hypothetical protein
VTAAVALLLVPVAWVARERQQMVQARLEILAAREDALRSFVREHELRQQHLSAPSSQPAPAITGELESVRRENAELKEQVKQLRSELERLRSEGRPAGPPNR